MEISKEQIDIISRFSKIENLEKELVTRLDELRISSSSLDAKMRELEKYESDIAKISKEKSQGFPWLAEAISEYLNLQDRQLAAYLTNKSHPARTSAQQILKVSREKRSLVKQVSESRYLVKYYEYLFPFLSEFRDPDIDELLIQIRESYDSPKRKYGNDDDPVKQYLVDREYLNLSVSDRNQRALERFLKSRTKNSYQIGKDYERYIGYLYESKEYKVTYFGIEQGIADLGRDLICKKGGKIEIIQCKYWSSEKKIHEKHINQLFGTTVKYYLEQNRQLSLSQFSKVIENRSITPVFYTTTSLTPTARQFAEALGVVVHEMFPYKPYPVIKCHINKVTGEKIYHLPFDQMYDKTILEKKYNEFYALTVEEAEKQGFRRAWRWSGQ